MVRFHPGSLRQARSVGVSAARLLGKEEGRVQFPDGPLQKTLLKTQGLLVQREDTWPATRKSGFDSPAVH
jgi:hypothetical protein